MKKIILLMLCSLPIIGMAQGIIFDTQVSSWKQLLDQAKQQNKFIFVDYMATWCGPCKKMDSEIYPDKDLGTLANSNFIAVKVQADSTKSDAAFVQTWYADAKAIRETYHVAAYPTYLFFSPEGKLVYRGTGFQKTKEFKALLNQALTSKDYEMLDDYRRHVLDRKRIPEAIKIAELLGNDSLSKIMGNDYAINYLMGLPKSALYTERNLSFLTAYVHVKDEKAFGLLLKDSVEINKILGNRAAQNALINIVCEDLIHAKLYEGGDFEKKVLVAKPNWNLFYKQIALLTDKDIAGRSVTSAKSMYYGKQANWLEYAKTLVESNERYGFAKTGWAGMQLTAQVATYIFPYVDDKRILTKAAEWVKEIADHDADPTYQANTLDVYANLLYKTGNVEKAIETELKAKVLTKNARMAKDYEETIEKFRKGIPTWNTGK